MAEPRPSLDQEVAALLDRWQQANERLLNGDIHSYLRLLPHAPDYTLMSPFGGPPTHGVGLSEERLAAIGRFFRSGTGRFELVASYAVADMIVLVVIERQRAAVGDLPEQDWPLRVTMVFRRDGEEWHVVHRHADSLVPGISVERAAELARSAGS